MTNTRAVYYSTNVSRALEILQQDETKRIFARKYRIYHGIEDCGVTGPRFGDGGTASKLTWDFFETNVFNEDDTEIICLEITKDALNIIRSRYA